MTSKDLLKTSPGPKPPDYDVASLSAPSLGGSRPFLQLGLVEGRSTGRVER